MCLFSFYLLPLLPDSILIADLLFSTVPIIYEQHRGWNTLQGSLPFFGVLLGTFFGAAVNVAYSQLVFAPQVDKHGGRVQPEKRLPPMSTSFKLLQS